MSYYQGYLTNIFLVRFLDNRTKKTQPNRLRKKSRSRLFLGFCEQNKNKLVCEVNLSGFILYL